MSYEKPGYQVGVKHKDEDLALWHELRASIVLLGAIAIVAVISIVAADLTSAIVR